MLPLDSVNNMVITIVERAPGKNRFDYMRESRDGKIEVVKADLTRHEAIESACRMVRDGITVYLKLVNKNGTTSEMDVLAKRYDEVTFEGEFMRLCNAGIRLKSWADDVRDTLSLWAHHDRIANEKAGSK